MQVAKAGDRKSLLINLGIHVGYTVSLVQIQPCSLYKIYGSLSGIGNAADCKSVASGIPGSSPGRPTKINMGR